ncbi:FAD-binding oxidoreductase [Fulvivirga sedimenti]|uniref:FAD-binding oxidoreductase n=1 Tax=Fulvivirga sedimenti TaxID=2879465 RepID=A0A9X1KWI9_9BACT|nr:FAD-binding oxidoreductase [Fulvivirga sedimenti]MCA6074840.1 FAD-binding oxidoreductase [Fulvivirga sedimenti]MCA6076017.1 FAD-binding oxidoreductase [Fulvivirga sedimenti]MCA6077145.1 FAD-binding oxidoreductase [Fulvivirga sedimenti]
MRLLKIIFIKAWVVLVWIFRFIVRTITSFFRFINKKKRRAIPFYLVCAYFLFVFILIAISGDSEYQKVLPDKRVNDVTELNPVMVGKIVQPHSVDDIVDAIRSTTGPISIGGGRFSMGGQTAFENSLHLDMRQFNKVLDLDVEKKQVTLQAGIVWRDLQKIIDKEDLSVKIMQTYANFTVGGSISVNCHGRYVGHGPIISSVIALKIVTSDGEVVNASRQENSELFRAAIGGYGGVGVIAEATLQLAENVKVERRTELLNVEDYLTYFDENVRNDSTVIFQNGDLYPPDYEVINNVSWRTSERELTDTTRVTPEGETYWLEPRLVNVVSWGDFGKWVRKKIIDPYVYKSESVVWRNKEASYDVAELEPSSREKQTYVLQEYFIPVKRITSFIPKMRDVFEKYDVNVINVSLRHAYPDKESFLSWADEEVFAFVVYYKQGTDVKSREKVKEWTVEMTDAILSENGKWYLPYQPHATQQQFYQAFSSAPRYFEVKHQFDSLNRFTNKLLDKYDPSQSNSIELKKGQIPGYVRAEEQTILTVPEWYLVFNPKEYADWLESGNNPSDFPYYSSIDEYWKLYDRSIKLASSAYPPNDEYITMLNVIGVSVTMEYAGKMIYENTVGRVFGWFANEEISTQERTIMEAQRAYSNFIYHTAWYEFEFLPWIGKVWRQRDESSASWLRKWERTLFFTFEFTLKAGYAQLIEWAARASYEEPVTDIYVSASSVEDIQPTSDLKIIAAEGNEYILAITRWGAFTETMLTLTSSNMIIRDIGGNDEIAVSVILNKDQDLEFSDAEILYTSELVTQPDQKRMVVLMNVDDLLPFIRSMKRSSSTIEHIFDY